jgi:hypothetical protein
MTVLMTGRNQWNLCGAEKIVQKTLRQMMIDAVQWMLLTVVIGKVNTKCGKVKRSTNIRRRWQISSDKLA